MTTRARFFALLAVAASCNAPRTATTNKPASATNTATGISVRVPILVYHSVQPHHPGQTAEQRLLDVDTTAFEAQMRYIAEHRYRVISLAMLADALEGKIAPPEHAVVITFDDGWVSQYHHAFPVLRRLGFTATFFVYTKPLDHDSLFMHWDQLREMQSAGMTIGSHSRTHPKLTDHDVALVDEVDSSRTDIQRHLGVIPEFFAYPYGAWDFRTIAAVRAAGYRGARELPGGVWNTTADLFNLRSVQVTDDMTAFEKALGP